MTAKESMEEPYKRYKSQEDEVSNNFELPSFKKFESIVKETKSILGPNFTVKDTTEQKP